MMKVNQRYMKYLFLFAILLCAKVAYSQDLIVTTTGDSLFCKILDVGADEIQFRYGTSGNVISIRRDETVMHRYNFKASSSSRASSREPKTEPTGGLYAALWSGANTFGKFSEGDADSGGAFVLGADVAYFFNPNLGVGLKINVANCDVNLSDWFLYRDRVIFFGPAFHFRRDMGKLSVNANVGAGGLNWQLSDIQVDKVSKDNDSATGFGAFLSAGVNFMATQSLGIGLNLQSALGSVKAGDYERHPASIGVVLGVNYRF